MAKVEILAAGLRLSGSAEAALFARGGRRAKRPMQTRSGVSGGLDLRLNEHTFVNAPVTEAYAAKATLELAVDADGFVIRRGKEDVCRAEPIPEPAFYSERTKDGSRLLRSIGQMCSPDRFCVGMTGHGCSFWRADNRCRYCSIGSDANEDANKKQEEHLWEALEAACSEPAWPARHILIGGGTPAGDDMGAIRAARLCEGVKQRFDLSVYVMIAAPLDDQPIDQLAAAGVDELGMNLEFWGQAAWREYIPGKHTRIGKARYLDALRRAVDVIGPHKTRSILIVGLEGIDDTLRGVETLTRMGVTPILSPFRPLRGSAMAEHRGFDAGTYIDMYNHAHQIASQQRGFVGPNCVCCQNNTLAFPYGRAYRRM